MYQIQKFKKLRIFTHPIIFSYMVKKDVVKRVARFLKYYDTLTLNMQVKFSYRATIFCNLAITELQITKN